MSLDPAEMELLFLSPESEHRIERKASIADADKLCQAICAFSNDLPDTKTVGVIFIGQNDDRSCAGLRIDTQLLETIGGWRSTGKFQPFPIMSVTSRSIAGCQVAVVSVQPSDNTPIRYDGRVWIRVGPRRAVASAEEEQRLSEKRRGQNIPPDARGVSDAALADIDLARFRLEYLPAAVSAETLLDNHRSDTEQMRALRLLDEKGRPTLAAVLVLGKRPQSFFPGAYIQMLRIDGRKLTDPIRDRHEILGTITDQIRLSEELAALWIETTSVVGDAMRDDRPTYPIAALRQLIRNAIMHRAYEGTHAPVRITWYDDRVEIQSPGGLFGHVTPETIGRPGITDYRNPTLAEALHALGFAERFGVGLQIVNRELDKNANPPIEYQILSNFVLVTLLSRS